MTKQLLWQLGCAVDVSTEAPVQTPSHQLRVVPLQPEFISEHPSHAIVMSALQLSPDELLSTQVGQHLLRYFFAGREAFDSRLHISTSVDIGRVGKRSRFLAAVVAPDNSSMWCPPQATLLKF